MSLTSVACLSLALFLSPREGLSLALGSAAPLPEIASFIQGERPAYFEPGKTYVIAFVATWDPRCRSVLLRMSALHEQFAPAGVSFLGLSHEPTEVVSAFLSKEDSSVRNRITMATDPDGSVIQAYLGANAQRAIPMAVVVKDAVVQWIGHPLFMEHPLTQVVQGNWELPSQARAAEGADRAHESGQQIVRQANAARTAKDWTTLLRLADEAIDSATVVDRSALQLNKAQLLMQAGRANEAYALIEDVIRHDASAQTRQLAASTILHTPCSGERPVALAVGYLSVNLANAAKPSPQLLAELGYAWAQAGDLSQAIAFTRRAQEAASAADVSMPKFAESLAAMLRDLEAKQSTLTAQPEPPPVE
jgi:thiol-disulfide isomerase/thioredoxin